MLLLLVFLVFCCALFGGWESRGKGREIGDCSARMNEMKENPRWDFTVKSLVNGEKNGSLLRKLIYFILFKILC